MPPAVAAAAITGAGAIAGGVLASSGNKAAAKASAVAGDKALAYQREQDALTEKHRLEDRAMQQAAWNAEQARKAPGRAAAASIWRRLGINVPDEAATAAMPPGWTGDVSTGAPTQAAPVTVDGLYGSGAQAVPETAPIATPTAQMTLEEFLGRRRPTTLDR